MQKTLYFLSVILFFSFTNGNDEITVTSKNSTLDCHMCPGYILIEKRNTIDTLKMGSWGSPPPFEQFKYKKKDFLVVNSSTKFESLYKTQKKRPTHVDLLSFAPPLGLEPRTL